MPDLGDYAFEVLTAYAVSLALIGVLVAASLGRAVHIKRRLGDREPRR